MQKVLVTGGAGFIGSHLVTSLLKRGLRVIVLDTLNKENMSTDLFSSYREDIRNTEAVERVIRQNQVDTCIHLAAKVNVASSIVNPAETLDTNIGGTKSVLEACTRNHVQNFVYASSAAVYGEPQSLPINEDHILQPLSPYGISKVAGEKLTTMYKANKNIRNIITLRFFNVYGQNHNPAYAGVISEFAKKLSKGDSPTIYGDGNQTRDFVSVHDVVQAIELAAESELSGVFNVATGKATSIKELAKKMILLFGLDIKPIYLKAMEGDIVHSYADVTKAKKLLHFEARHDLDSELKTLLINVKMIENP